TGAGVSSSQSLTQVRRWGQLPVRNYPMPIWALKNNWRRGQQQPVLDAGASLGTVACQKLSDANLGA
ncbi:hypothetical protein VS884_26540, partial [Escherichia coli]